MLVAKKGVNCTCADRSGITPIYEASMESDVMMKLLLARPEVRATLNDVYDDGMTIMAVCIEKGIDVPLSLLLEEQECDPNIAYGNPPCTALIKAIQLDSPLLKLLLECHRVDVNTNTIQHGMALHLAIKLGNYSANKLLLHDKLDVNQKSVPFLFMRPENQLYTHVYTPAD